MNFTMLFIAVLLVVWGLPKVRTFGYDYALGRPWPHKDLVAPFDFAIKKTPVQLENDTKRAVQTVPPVYRYDSKQTELILANYTKVFDEQLSSLPKNEILGVYNEGLQTLKKLLEQGVIEVKHLPDADDERPTVLLVKDNIGELKYLNNFYTVAQALSKAKLLLYEVDRVHTRALLTCIATAIRTNVLYDNATTQNALQKAAEEVSAYRGLVLKGQIVAERGQLVDNERYQVLNSLRVAYEENVDVNIDFRWIGFGQFLLLLLISSLLMVFLMLFRPDIYAETRKVFLVLIIITVMLAILSIAIKLQIPNVYVIPYCMVPIIIRVLFDTRMAMYIHLLVVLFASLLVPNGLEFSFIQIVAGMAAIFSIKNLLRRSQFLVSAGIILIVYCVAGTGIHLLQTGSISNMPLESYYAYFFSVTLSLLAYPGIYLFERSFGLTSEITLMELAGANHPLLREMSYKAPGTFQHSLQVANLSERAIYQIGGNALLARCGALYHDIGKLENPQYFIENQNSGQNPHDELSFEESAQIIIRHVSYGVTLGKRHKLPQVLIDFIQTHHGTTLMSYFYNSFLKSAEGSQVEQSRFTYPGPIPFTREQAIVMLADSVEAASRSLQEPDEQKISDLVERIVDYKLELDQLEDSDITLKDLTVVKRTFKEMLNRVYHVRVNYPQYPI